MPENFLVLRRIKNEMSQKTESTKGYEKTWTFWLLSLLFPQTFRKVVSCEEDRLWPIGLNESHDRILNQLNFSLSHTRHKPSRIDDKRITPNNNLKKILVIPGARTTGQNPFLQDKCPVNNCFFTSNKTEAPNADAVLFNNQWPIPLVKKPKGQIWIVYMLESPANTGFFKSFGNHINITATYRLDSTIVTPYEFFRRNRNESLYQLLPPKRNYASGKTKKVAWFVSHCSTPNNRMQYALELSKYIEVDIYGPCAKLKCPRRSKTCFEKLDTDYKFYLAFENSNCKDYITEKLFWNGLL